MRHADSAPSVYGNSILWLSGFAKQKIVKYESFIGGKLLSHSIELLYTEGGESACLIGWRDTPYSRTRGRGEVLGEARVAEACAHSHPVIPDG